MTPEQRAFAKALGATIRRQRIKFGLSQTRLANRIGATDSAIGQWEVGDHMPSLRRLSKTVQVLETTLSELFRRVEARLEAANESVTANTAHDADGVRDPSGSDGRKRDGTA